MNALQVSTADRSDSSFYIKSNAVDLKEKQMKIKCMRNGEREWKWKAYGKENLRERNKQPKLRMWEEEQSSSSSYQNFCVICSAQVFFLDKPKFMIATTAPV